MGTTKAQRVGSRREYRIVSVEMGSWKWQNAYSIVEYRQVRLKNGKIVWKSHGPIAGAAKLSMPQLCCKFPEHLSTSFGSIHYQQVVR